MLNMIRDIFYRPVQADEGRHSRRSNESVPLLPRSSSFRASPMSLPMRVRLTEKPKHAILDIARVIEQRFGRAVREDDGRARGEDRVACGRVGRVRDVYQDAEAVELRDELVAKGAQSGM